jgi:hypothetical protein
MEVQNRRQIAEGMDQDHKSGPTWINNDKLKRENDKRLCVFFIGENKRK